MPALCIQIFRLGDFFLLDELKAKATAELSAYIDNELKFLVTNTDGGQSPEWLTEVLDTIEEAYKGIRTEPILEVLLKFVRANKRQIFKFKDATGLLDKIPEMAMDLMKGYLAGVEPRTCKFRVGLPVFAAIHSSNELFESETAQFVPAGLAELPCLLYPTVNNPRFPFTVVSPVTEQEIDGLGWMAPRASEVMMITSHSLSKIVRVDMSEYPRSKTWLHMRFDDSKDAKAFVERYCRANPRIESATGNSATAMSAAMRVRVARVSDTSLWLRRHFFEDSNWNH